MPSSSSSSHTLIKGSVLGFPHATLQAYNVLKYRSHNIAHGNIVALHSEVHNRFIRVSDKDVNGHGGRRDIDKLPLHWESEKFLVVEVAESTFAFYSVPHGEYICMDRCRRVTARTKQEQDDRNNNEHHFIVRNEGWGTVTLLSVAHGGYVRMDLCGDIDGKANVAKEWEHYNVVLLMANPDITATECEVISVCP